MTETCHVELTIFRIGEHKNLENPNLTLKYIESSGNDRIQDIAERVGFGNNPQYFSQLFKKKTGITPSAYTTSIHG